MVEFFLSKILVGFLRGDVTFAISTLAFAYGNLLIAKLEVVTFLLSLDHLED